MKVAKLVYYSFMTRVIVDENATESQIVLASKKNMIAKVNTELGENLEEIRSDDECPIGTFPTDNPTIDRVILNPDMKQYLVIGKGIVSQIISFDDYSHWGTIVDVNRDEDGITTQGCSWGNAKITVTKLPLLEVYLIL